MKSATVIIAAGAALPLLAEVADACNVGDRMYAMFPDKYDNK